MTKTLKDTLTGSLLLYFYEDIIESLRNAMLQEINGELKDISESVLEDDYLVTSINAMKRLSKLHVLKEKVEDDLINVEFSDILELNLFDRDIDVHDFISLIKYINTSSDDIKSQERSLFTSSDEDISRPVNYLNNAPALEDNKDIYITINANNVENSSEFSKSVAESIKGQLVNVHEGECIIKVNCNGDIKK